MSLHNYLIEFGIITLESLHYHDFICYLSLFCIISLVQKGLILLLGTSLPQKQSLTIGRSVQ